METNNILLSNVLDEAVIQTVGGVLTILGAVVAFIMWVRHQLRVTRCKKYVTTIYRESIKDAPAYGCQDWDGEHNHHKYIVTEYIVDKGLRNLIKERAALKLGLIGDSPEPFSQGYDTPCYIILFKI